MVREVKPILVLIILDTRGGKDIVHAIGGYVDKL
jgi:hypothetical protein